MLWCCHSVVVILCRVVVATALLLLILLSLLLLLPLLQKCLESWTSKIEVGAQAFSWCVGGSLAATMDARGQDGSSSTLRFVACRWAPPPQ